ncbi:response regulator transcription factor [Amycolatopsis sp. H20-H5]|uniref:response regulator transcription factor n=1 Tax=Amycolatopsis sp. H20-H5 TaxID=3046309 RepID=UPI002DC05413|nr:response regulator transcription factor [Amycolatopsis sp. H20-H5]MEC3979437.1 response regulator transcription factor [Amycolatopsis sp. H20-H5]
MLLVEDDRELAGLLAEMLDGEGYETDQAHDGQRGLHLGLTGHYAVMILDRRLPVMDGLGLLSGLRRKAVTTRVLMLSALGEVSDRVAGLDAGADDYLVKPFEMDEMLARVRALCRRDLDGADCLPLGEAALDLVRREVILERGRRVTLSGREFELLRTLAQRPKVIHPRSSLQTEVFADTNGESIVDTYVYYLRRKLGRGVVRTVHGLGYQLGAV